MAFQYSPQWLKKAQVQPRFMPLSLALPLREQSYGDTETRPFFANLLPESELRTAISRKLGLSEQNDFALLEAVGGECAGAVSLLPVGQTLPTEAGYKVLDDTALEALVTTLPKQPMLVGEHGLRLSLAGAQNKLPVGFDGERISLPLGATPSSHILKPPIQRYPDSVYNEAFCMQLARRIGLPVPWVTVLQSRQPLYLIERYDRQRGGEELQRLHQEDFCQALGIPPEQKYEKEGGPSLPRCFALLREVSTMPLIDIQALLQWVIFNVLIGNADAHGKNLSLLLTSPGPRLAPFYDLMCTAIYPDLSDRQAMRIGGEDRPEWISQRHWQRFADDIGVGYKFIQKMLESTGQQVVEQARILAGEFDGDESHRVVEKILAVIRARHTKITRMLELTQS